MKIIYSYLIGKYLRGFMQFMFQTGFQLLLSRKMMTISMRLPEVEKRKSKKLWPQPKESFNRFLVVVNWELRIRLEIGETSVLKGQILYTIFVDVTLKNFKYLG